MKNNFLKKLIIILIAFLMVFSVVGQFFVSGQEKDIEDNPTDKQQIEVVDEKITEIENDKEIIEEKDETDIIEQNEPTEEKPEIKEEPTDVDNNKDADKNTESFEELAVEEQDGLPQVEPFNVTSFSTENDISPFSTNQTLDNPKLPDSKFQVVTITNAGKIKPVAYKSTYKEADALMKTIPNGAIRHHKSHSPMKFIAANKAILHAVPHRLNSNSNTRGDATMNISNSTATTYISRGFEMAYFETNSYDEKDGTGSVTLGISGFKGTAQLKQLDIIPMAYVINKKIVSLGGSSEATSDFYKTTRLNAAPAQSYYKAETVDGVKQFSYISENLHRAPNDAYTQHYHAALTIGLADEDWMKEGGVFYSWDGVNFYHDRDYANLAGTYYNYYQHLPLRSKTNLKTKDFDNYLNKLGKKDSVMKDLGNAFLYYGEEYGMNPLLVYALAAHESGWGTSNIAKTKYNLFGWNAFDSDPSLATDFYSPTHAVKDHMGINLRKFIDVTYDKDYYIKDWRYHGAHLGNRGSGLNLKYASDPFWGMKIAGIAYSIDTSVGLKDYKNYALGIVNDGNEYLVKRENVAATNDSQKVNKNDVLYTFKSINNHLYNVTTILSEANNGFYKSQSFAMMDSKSNIVNITGTTPHLKYDWDKSVGYIKKNKVTKIHSDVKLPSNIIHPKQEKLPKPALGNEKPDFKIGDVNGDGKITLVDLALIKSHLLNNRKLNNNEIIRADINKDGKITLGDLAQVKAHLLGNIKLD